MTFDLLEVMIGMLIVETIAKSYDAVRRYAKVWSKEQGSVTAEAFVPLTFGPGEAYQFDWSHERRRRFIHNSRP